jgi:predicted transcriptional regulator
MTSDREAGRSGRREMACVNHVRISAAAPAEAETPQSAHAVIETLQDHLDQLRVRLLAPDTAAKLAVGEAKLTIVANEILRTRRKRDTFFGGDLFGEPAWDILLELFAAQHARRRLSVSGVCYASAVPVTTALRWIERLENDGWIERMDDPGDRRRSWITLTEKGSTAMEKYLENVAVRPF